MATTTQGDRDEREKQVLVWLSEMKPRTEILKLLQEEGWSAATASRTLKNAEKDLVQALSESNREVLLAQCIEILNKATHMALEQKNPAGVSACVGQLAKLVGIGQVK